MIVVIDFSNLVWSAFHSSLRFTKYEPENCPPEYTGHVDAFHQKLIKILQEQPCTEYYFALDSNPQGKFNIYPEYKKTRKRIAFKPKKAIYDLLEAWKAKVMYSEYMEADDVIAAYVADHLDDDITVATTDKDLWQLAENPKTKIYNFHKGIFVTKRELNEAYGIDDFSQIKLCKTLWGDASDNVPNLIPRMQKNLMPHVVLTDGTLREFMKAVDKNWDSLSERCRQILDANRDKLKTNYELVRLNFDCEYCISEFDRSIVERGAGEEKEKEEKEKEKENEVEINIDDIPF